MIKNITCTKCGSGDVKEIVYGYPLKDGESEKNVIYGGCVIHDDSPKYECKNCEHTFGMLNVGEY